MAGLKRQSEGPSLSPPPTKRKIESSTTNKAVANFFAPASKKEPEPVTWRVVKQSLLVGKYVRQAQGQEASVTPAMKRRKIAGFDLDSTLISTASGNKFARNPGDWKWWNSSVPAKLRELDADGYQVVILSNQGAISLKSDQKTIKADQKGLLNFKTRVSAVFRNLDIGLSLYAATAKDEFRKPRVGMWKEMLEDYDLDVGEGADLAGSFFVGDAGGREALNGRAKDFSCSDRNFAANIGMAFHTPEEFFLDEPIRPFTREFEPAGYVRVDPQQTKEYSFQKGTALDLVLFCGSPGCGKSTYYWQVLKPLGYERVNQDILKSRNRCLDVAQQTITAGQPVVIDNTNADIETRTHWIELARKLKIPIRCIHFTAPASLCEHNNAFRALNPDLVPEKREMLPAVAFLSFRSRYQEPSLKEGFQDILKVDFQFQGTAAQQQAWARYWV